MPAEKVLVGRARSALHVRPPFVEIAMVLLDCLSVPAARQRVVVGQTSASTSPPPLASEVMVVGDDQLRPPLVERIATTEPDESRPATTHNFVLGQLTRPKLT